MPAHVQFAENFVNSMAAQVREPRTITDIRPASITKERLKALFPLDTFDQSPAVRDQLVSALLEVSEKERQASNKQTLALMQLVNSLREELDMLWWLQNAYSQAAEKPLSELSVAESSLAIAFELAGITRFLPGPASILGMIVTSLSYAKGGLEISLKEAVNSLPRACRQTHATESTSGGQLSICPVHLAVATSLETEGEEDWIPVFNKRAKLSAGDTKIASQISNQG
jgi:hypothetical protein